MTPGQLDDYFAGVGAKCLSAVDAEPTRSNQHEIGVTKDMRTHVLRVAEAVLRCSLCLAGRGAGRVDRVWDSYRRGRRCPPWASNLLRHAGEPAPPLTGMASVLPIQSRYGSHEHRRRAVLGAAQQRAPLLHRCPSRIHSEQQLSWLFGVRPGKGFVVREIEPHALKLDLAGRFMLDELGVELEEWMRLDWMSSSSRSARRFPARPLSRTSHVRPWLRTCVPEMTRMPPYSLVWSTRRLCFADLSGRCRQAAPCRLR